MLNQLLSSCTHRTDIRQVSWWTLSQAEIVKSFYHQPLFISCTFSFPVRRLNCFHQVTVWGVRHGKTCSAIRLYWFPTALWRVIAKWIIGGWARTLAIFLKVYMDVWALQRGVLLKALDVLYWLFFITFGTNIFRHPFGLSECCAI